MVLLLLIIAAIVLGAPVMLMAMGISVPDAIRGTAGLKEIEAAGESDEGFNASERWERKDYVKMIHKTIKQEIEVFGEAKTTCHCGNCKATAAKAQRQLDYELKRGKKAVAIDYDAAIDSYMSKVDRTYEPVPEKVIPEPPKPWWFSKEYALYNREYFFYLPGDIDPEDAESYSVHPKRKNPESAQLSEYVSASRRGYMSNHDAYKRVADSQYSRPIGCTCRELAIKEMAIGAETIEITSDLSSVVISSYKPTVHLTSEVGNCPACEATKNCQRTRDCKCDDCVKIDIQEMAKRRMSY